MGEIKRHPERGSSESQKVREILADGLVAHVGIIGQSVAFKGGSSGVVDRDYLVESIKYPDKKLRVGYSVAMPYNNLTDEQISDIVDYIEALSQ